MQIANIVLATVKDGQPHARYHVHRGFVRDLAGLDTEYLYTTTDLRMPKGNFPIYTEGSRCTFID